MKGIALLDRYTFDKFFVGEEETIRFFQILNTDKTGYNLLKFLKDSMSAFGSIASSESCLFVLRTKPDIIIRNNSEPHNPYSHSSKDYMDIYEYYRFLNNKGAQWGITITIEEEKTNIGSFFKKDFNYSFIIKASFYHSKTNQNITSFILSNYSKVDADLISNGFEVANRIKNLQIVNDFSTKIIYQLNVLKEKENKNQRETYLTQWNIPNKDLISFTCRVTCKWFSAFVASDEYPLISNNFSDYNLKDLSSDEHKIGLCVAILLNIKHQLSDINTSVFGEAKKGYGDIELKVIIVSNANSLPINHLDDWY